MADANWSPPEADFAPSPPKAANWSPPEADFAPQEAPPETASRVAGLAGRGVMTGAAGLPNTIQELATLPTTVAASLGEKLYHRLKGDPDEPAPATAPEPYKPRLSDFVHPERWQQAAEFFADKAGLPKPETPHEHIGYAAAQALPSAALAPEAPIAGALSSMAGAGASEAVKQSGGSPTAQTLTGLAVGSIPGALSGAAQGARSLFRDSAQATKQRIADAATSGIPLNVGEASGSKFLQKVQATSQAFWGSGPFDHLADQQRAALHDRIAGIVDNLTPQGAVISPMGAGAAINQGKKATLRSMAAAEEAAYNHLDSLVHPDTPIDMTRTLALANKLAAPNPGAVASTSAAIPDSITNFRDNLVTDLKGGNTLPYSAVRAMRTNLGDKANWNPVVAKGALPNGARKLLYGQMTQDLADGVSWLGKDAKDAADTASSLYAQNQQRRKDLNNMITKVMNNGGTEAVYNATTSKMSAGSTRISKVMSALNPDEQNVLRATVIDRLGRAKPNLQNAQGSEFSPSTFLTNYTDQKFSPEAKDALFGQSTPLRSALDSLANTTSTLRNSKALKNPSGTGPLGAHAWQGYGVVSEILGSLLLGHPLLAAAGAASPVANNVLARVMTNPRTVNWMAKSAKLPPSLLPNAVNQLQRTNDPDAQDLATYLGQAQPAPAPVARASGGKVDDDIEPLVTKLMGRWKAAKKATDASTKPLLHVPDATIQKALEIAGRAI
jgi:hypothetical protein